MTRVRPLRHVLRWTLGIGLGLVVLLGVAAAAVLLFAGGYDFAPLAASRLTAALDRKVTIGALHVTPGRWLQVRMQDFQLANLPNGSQPAMTTVARLSAEIQALSLLHGPVVVRKLTVTGLQLLLERTPDDRKNWKFGAHPVQDAPPKPTPRAGFPTLLDAQIAGDVVFRTSSGHLLVTHLDPLRLQADAADQPVRLTADGSYNAAPIKLQAALASLDALRDTATAYPARIDVASGDTTLRFDGTMTAPLDLDGARGRLELVAPTSAAILQIAGTSGGFDASVRLAGPFEHEGALWHLTQASGTLNTDTVTAADLKLVEGPHGKPDTVTIDIAFDRLNLNALLAAKKPGAAADADMPLTIDRAPDTLIAAKLSAHELAYAGVRAADVTFGGALKPGRITVDVLSLGYAGATFQASGQIEAAPAPGSAGGGHVTANVDMARMDVQVLRKLLAAADLPLIGKLTGKVLVDATGATLNQAAHAARLSAVLMMDNGSISRQIIELASTDARSIFRKASGMSPIACLLAVLDIRGGVGTVSPLRIRSQDGTITGQGSFDVYRHLIDITIASDSRTTGSFALDVPVRVSGALASPTIRPATFSAAGRAELSASDNISRLLPTLQPLARRSPCLSARAG